MDTNLKIVKPIVSVQWLLDNLSASNLVILDATIPKVGQSTSDLDSNIGIEKALFFDIKKVFSKKDAPFPNTIVSPVIFEKEVCKLGINSDAAIVIYDKHGVYSSPRAWWLFKAMGHTNVAVLNGGLPEWEKENYPCREIIDFDGEIGNFKTDYQFNCIYDYDKVLEAISDDHKLIIDARSSDRFEGLKPEPRAGLRSGHIPNSKNLPFTELIQNGKILPALTLTQKFERLNNNNSEIIFSCGSGITACILALGAEAAGYKNLSVYDGSWTEWGSLLELPIEK